MFQSDRITSVHLDVTDKCNASCPMCPRTVNGGPRNPHLKNQEMSLADAKVIFNVPFLKQLHFIQLCGNFGDPMVAKDTLDILEYFRSVNPSITLGFHTNGSGRDKDWWQRLGQLLSRPGDYCKFGIDGLEDTNGIYRRRTRWDKIMSSVQHFVSAGGIAHWEFLVFKHNEHQVETARKMAEEIGFRQFFVKKTSRFFNYQMGKNIPFPIYDKNKETVGYLNPPDNEDFVNPVSTFVEQSDLYVEPSEAPPEDTSPNVDAEGEFKPIQSDRDSSEPLSVDIENSSTLAAKVTDEALLAHSDKPTASGNARSVVVENNSESLGSHLYQKAQNAVDQARVIKDSYVSLDEYFRRTQVSCMSLKDKSIFVNSDGAIYPCCFLGGRVDRVDRGEDGDRLEDLAIKAVGSLDLINAKNDTIQNIINGAWFKGIAQRWEPDVEERDRLETCSQICGQHINLVAGEYA